MGTAEFAGVPEQSTGKKEMRLHGQAVKTSPFHGGNTGSIPVGVMQSPEGLPEAGT